MDNDSDHLPVRTVLDLSLASNEIKQARVWNKINEELLIRVLRLELSIPHTSGSRKEIDHTAALISIALQEAAVPLSRGCLRSVSGWTDECKEIQMECRRLKRRHQIQVTGTSTKGSGTEINGYTRRYSRLNTGTKSKRPQRNSKACGN